MSAETKGHPHAALMAEFAKDAAAMERPWKAWEFFDPGYGWAECQRIPSWNAASRFRRKPRTIRIGDIDVPEPVREALEAGTAFHIADPTVEMFYLGDYKWSAQRQYSIWLARGLVHLTAEAAAAHGRALCALTSKAEGGQP